MLPGQESLVNPDSSRLRVRESYLIQISPQLLSIGLFCIDV